MAVGCLASLVLWVAVALVILRPELLLVLVGLVVVFVITRAVLSNPDWPVI